MANISLYLDTRRARKDGTFPLKINVRHRKNFLLPTDFHATRETWEGNEYNRKEPSYKAKNTAIRAMLNMLEEHLLRLSREGRLNHMTDEALKKDMKKMLSGEENRERCFVDYLDEFVSSKSNQGTRTVYSTTRNKLLAYDPKCRFETMDRKWLEGFARWMEDGGMKVNAYAIHLRNVRAVFNYCIDEEYTKLYPFRKFAIKKEETRKRSLTAEQLRMLRDYPCEEYQRRYRDMFMLMFYLIGINAADLFLARPGDLVNGRLEYKRAKTGRLYSVKVEPEAQAILDRYRGRDYLLCVMDEYRDYKNFLHRMDIALKEIGGLRREGRGGKKVRTPLFPDLSSYWSRHTWATLAASLDIPKETISEALGHSLGSSVTSIYIRFDRRKVDEANRRVIDYVNGEGTA